MSFFFDLGINLSNVFGAFKRRDDCITYFILILLLFEVVGVIDSPWRLHNRSISNSWWSWQRTLLAIEIGQIISSFADLTQPISSIKCPKLWYRLRKNDLRKNIRWSYFFFPFMFRCCFLLTIETLFFLKSHYLPLLDEFDFFTCIVMSIDHKHFLLGTLAT